MAHPEGGEQVRHPPGQVLAAAIAVQHCTSEAAPSLQRCIDGLGEQVIGHAVRECPAHDAARAKVQHRGEVAKPSLVRTYVMSLT